MSMTPNGCKDSTRAGYCAHAFVSDVILRRCAYICAHVSVIWTMPPHTSSSGGKVLSAHTRKTSNRVTAALRLAAVTVGRTSTALGAFYRRLAARIGNAKAVTATARKIAVLFYNAMRFGRDYKEPGADHYEQQYRDRVLKQLHRRAAQFGLILQPQNSTVVEYVS